MSRRGRGAGRQISSGRLRVDAGRAVAKLRDYQLPDPLLWCLEIVRAATAAGATTIVTTGDTDDLWIGWQGAVPEVDDLRDVLNELVSPAPAKERRWLRLMAIGINTALGLQPRYVDIFVLRESGNASRIRFTPSMLKLAADEAAPAPLRGEIQEEAIAPVGFAGPGVVVQMRRQPSLDAVYRFVVRRPVPELDLIASMGADSELPLMVSGQRVSGRNQDLIRVPLGPSLHGFIAITRLESVRREQPIPPKAYFAELGIHLATPVLELPGQPKTWASSVPIRLFLDAPRLPTNASRSEVRTGEPPARDALKLIPKVLAKLIEELVSREDEESRRAAIQILAAFVAGKEWHQSLGRLPKWAKPLADAPVIRNALGQLKSPTAMVPSFGSVHRSRKPMDEHYGPWFSKMLWVPPGADEALLLGSWYAPDAKEQRKAAKKHMAAYDKWMRHDQREPVVPPEPGQWLVFRFGPKVGLGPSMVPKSRFERFDMRGEICLLNPEKVGFRRKRFGQITLLKEGRPLSSRQIPFPFPFEAVIEAPKIEATDDYRDAIRTEAFEGAIGAAIGGAFRAVELLAASASGKKNLSAEGELRAELDAASVRALAPFFRECQLHANEQLGKRDGASEARAAATQRALKGPLLKVDCWPLLHNGEEKLASLAGLYELCRTKKGGIKEPLLIVHDSKVKKIPSGRHALLLDHAERDVLTHLLPHAEMIRYNTTHQRREGSVKRLARLISVPGSVTLLIEEEHRRGAVSWGATQSRVRYFHCHVQLQEEAFSPRYVPCSIAVDDDTIVPNETWMGIAYQGTDFSPHTWELKWLSAVIDALGGELSEDLLFDGKLTAAHRLHAELLVCASKPNALMRLGKSRRQTLFSSPLIQRLGVDALCSLDDLSEIDEPIAWLDPAEKPRFETGDWHPLLIERDVVTALKKLLNKKLRHAGRELEKRRTKVQRERNLIRHRQKSPVSLPELSPTVLELHGDGRQGAVTLANATQGDAMVIEVLVEGRPFCQISSDQDMPVRAYVDLDLRHVDEEAMDLADHAKAHLIKVTRASATRVVLALAETEPQRLCSDPTAMRLLRKWLELASSRASKNLNEARRTLARAPIFASIQGPPCSLEEASSKAQTRIAEWTNDWLEPSESEKPHALDSPIIRVVSEHSDPVRDVIAMLGSRTPVSRTRAVKALQGKRRIDRGLVPVPRVTGVDPARRKLVLDLVPDRRRARLLGPGEIAFAEGKGAAELHLYSGGSEVGVIELGLEPRVLIAMESPELGTYYEGGSLTGNAQDRLQGQLRPVLLELFKETIEPLGHELSNGLKESIRRALLLDTWLEGHDVGDVPLFETTSDEHKSLRDVEGQADRFGDVWVTTRTSYLERTRTPLDPKRFALRLTQEELQALQKLFKAVEADDELALDEQARTNMSMPKVVSLDIPSHISPRSLLGRLSYEDGGATGRLALLSHSSRSRAAVHLYREMLPLGRIEMEQGDWPILALIDQPKLKPNRTWSGAIENKVVRRIRERLRKVTEAHLQKLIPEVEGALRKLNVDRAYSMSRVKDGTVRGVFWLPRELAVGGLEGDLGNVNELRVYSTSGRNLPIRGYLLAAFERQSSGTALQSLARYAYGVMLRTLAIELARGHLAADDAPAALAHIVEGVFAGVLGQEKSLKRLQIPLFHPKPMTLSELRELAESKEKIEVRKPDEVTDKHCVLDDGSPAAEALIGNLGSRAQRRGPLEIVPTSLSEIMKQRSAREPKPKSKSKSKSKPKSKPKPKRPPRRAHALDPLAKHLHATLTAIGIGAGELEKIVVIPNRRRGLLEYNKARKRIELSGKHASLVALQAARLSRSSDAERGMRALAAHATGVLNRALSSINDASERGAILALLKE